MFGDSAQKEIISIIDNNSQKYNEDTYKYELSQDPLGKMYLEALEKYK